MRDIPGSKTILIATAWGIVTSVFPAIATSAGISFKTILAFLWTTSLVFSRTAFLDILDMQGDMIVGKETIPILIGEAKTLKILKYTLACIILLFIFSGILNWISTLGFFLIICPLLMFLFILFHEKGYIYPATRLEILIELNLILAGVITLIWSAAIA
jgi:4-hydroxy-3-methylbut-2-enyl diphosphate reductase